MIGLLKRDFLINKSAFVAIFTLIPFGYLTWLPPFQICLGLLLMVLVISLSFLDHRANINRYLISLPIQPKMIVHGRYQLLFLIWFGVVVYQLLIGLLVDRVPGYDTFVFGWKEIITLFSLGLIIMAILVPLYYWFQSFVFATILVGILYFVGFLFTLNTLVNQSGMTDVIIFNDLDQWIVPFIEEHISFLPFLILPLAGLISYLISMKISEKVFLKKDLI